jgi:hypothetical protein
LAGSLCRNLLLSKQDLEDELQPQLQVPQVCQINPNTTFSFNPIINQGDNYMDHDTTIEFGDGVRSEKKRPKILEARVGQRRKDAMLSVQRKAIVECFFFSWLPPDMLTGCPTLPKPSFINKRFGWLILPKPSLIKPRFGG